MGNIKDKHLICVYVSVISVLLLICALLIYSGIASPFISCFAIDSDDRLYVGKHDRIDVFENGVLTNSIFSKTSRGYVFTILEDDTIQLSTSTIVYSMDLNGNIISSYEDNGSHVYNQIQKSKFSFITTKDDAYCLKGILGRTRIIKNNTIVVYQLSPLSFMVKIALYAIAFSVVIFTVLIGRYRKKTGRYFR